MIFNLLNDHSSISVNPIIQSFFSHEENLQLLNQSKKNPNDNSEIILLNHRFNIYFTNVKRMNYIARLIRGTAIDYDKKTKKYSSRFISTDIFNEEESLTTFNDNYENTDTFDALITNEDLLKAIKSLTSKQIHILELFFIHSKSNLEIADLYNTTPQNVSQIRRKALKRIKELIRREADVYVS